MKKINKKIIKIIYSIGLSICITLNPFFSATTFAEGITSIHEIITKDIPISNNITMKLYKSLDENKIKQDDSLYYLCDNAAYYIVTSVKDINNNYMEDTDFNMLIDESKIGICNLLNENNIEINKEELDKIIKTPKFNEKILGITKNTGSDYSYIFEISEIFHYILVTYGNNENITPDALFNSAMSEIFNSIDVYSDYFTAPDFKNFIQEVSPTVYGIGVELNKDKDNNLIISKVLDESPAKNNGLKEGDKIIKINNVDVSKMNPQDVINLNNDNVDTQKIIYVRSGKTMEVNITKKKINKSTVQSFEVSDYLGNDYKNKNSNIGVISISSISETSSEDFIKYANKLKDKGVENLVIDFRDDGGGDVDQAIKICQEIIPKGDIITFFDKEGNKKTYKSELESPPFKKIAILADGYTASACEVIASAVQDSNIGVIIGQKTYGKGCGQKLIMFPNKGGYKLTIFENLTRNGIYYNNIGLTPDIEAGVTILGELMSPNIGETSRSIENLKNCLDYLGYKTTSQKNLFDQNTSDVLKKYQKENGLSTTGKVDEPTIYSIDYKILSSWQKNDPFMLEAVKYFEKN